MFWEKMTLFFQDYFQMEPEQKIQFATYTIKAYNNELSLIQANEKYTFASSETLSQDDRCS